MAMLLDSLTALARPTTLRLAAQLNESEASVAAALSDAFASILDALLNKAHGSLDEVFGLITERPNDTDLPSDSAGVLAAIDDAASPAAMSGARFLNSLFGTRTDTVGDLIARAHSFTNPASGRKLLSFAALLAAGLLSKSVRDDGLTSAELERLLMTAAPSMPEVTDMHWSRIAPTPVTDRRRKEAHRRWTVPIVTLGSLMLLWLLMPQRSGREQGVGATRESDRGRTPAIVATEGGEVSGNAAGVPVGFIKRSLPNGVELTIPSGGLEATLIAFVQNPVRSADDTTWMDFDRIHFVSGSARLSHESDEQLQDVAAVLNAYPTVHVKIGGYTDDKGAPKSNLWLSQRRADAVKVALVKRGIAPDRLWAEGYGERDPIADNSTSEGRAENRRIALHVTAK